MTNEEGRKRAAVFAQNMREIYAWGSSAHRFNYIALEQAINDVTMPIELVVELAERRGEL